MLTSTLRILLQKKHRSTTSLTKFKYIQSLHLHSNTPSNHYLIHFPSIIITNRHNHTSHSRSSSPQSTLRPTITQHTKSSDFNHQPHNYTEHINPYHPNRDTPNNSETETPAKNVSKHSKSNVTPSNISHASIMGILLHHAWPDTRELRVRSLLAISLMISSKLVVVSIPFWYKAIIDVMSSTSPMVIPIYLVAGYGISRAMASFCREAQGAVFAHVTMSGTRKMAQQLFYHLHALDLEFHLNKQTGLLSKAIDRGVRAITYICNTTLINVVPTALEVALVCGILGYQFEDKSFLLCTASTVGVYMLWSVAITQYRTKLRQNMNKVDNASSAHVVDSLINYETVKYFNNEQLEMNKYGDIMRQYQKAAVKVQTSLSVLNAGQNVIFTTGLTYMLYLACNGIMLGTMTVGDLVLVNTLLFQLSVPLNFIGSVYREVKLALTDLETMMKLTHTQSAVVDDPLKNPQPLILDHGPNIEFKNVSFGYDLQNMNTMDDGRSILNECSFDINGGSKVAIIGGSGSGKSTILKLLYRFYNLQDGEILINGINIDNITLQSLREHIGIVPQDIVLFNDTLYNNIKYGANYKEHQSISDDDIYRVCKQAQLHDFIMSLPDKYETVVGERGLKLSGGEKQRVAISRMLLKKCQIVIMDEPTSSLDSATESDILCTINNIRNDDSIGYKPTTMVIAHRLSTITDSDCILVLSHGRLVEKGTHQELIEMKDGFYKYLWDFQSNTTSD